MLRLYYPKYLQIPDFYMKCRKDVVKMPVNKSYLDCKFAIEWT